MNVMISQPMKGKSIKQIQNERREAVERLEAEGHTVIDSIINSPKDAAISPIECLAKSIEIMSQCDAVCFIGEWYNARGCRVEKKVAEEYGLWVMTI